MTKGAQRAIVVSPMKSWQKIHASAEKNGCQHRTPFSKCSKKAFYMLNGKGYCEKHKPNGSCDENGKHQAEGRE